MDLSKAYDSLPHDLLIANLEAYGLDNGILQGSILGPPLFNIFINDIFMITEQADICNFADDNTLY